MHESFGLKEAVAIIAKEKKLIAVIVLTLTALGIIVSLLIPPVYQAKTELLVNFSKIKQDSNEINPNEIETNLRLIETYKYIIGSSRILDHVAEEYGGSLSSADLEKKITVKADENTQIITIVAKDSNPENAAEIADLTAGFFKRDIMKLMQLDNVQILTEAKVNGSDALIQPKTVVFSFISFCLSVLVAVLAIIWKENVLNRLDSMEKIERHFDVPALGLVPFLTKRKIGRFGRMLRREAEPDSQRMVAESYRTIRTHLKYMIKEKNAKTIMVTSTNPGDGKTLLTANIAISMAKQNLKTLYIDLDLRRGVGRYVLSVPGREGISQCLSGQRPIDKLIYSTKIPSLSFLGTGPYPSDPAELLSSDRMAELIGDLKKKYDIIMIDCPPLLIADPLIISGHVDGCVIVADARKTKIDQMAENIRKLRKVKTDIWGIVLNKAKTSSSNLYY